MTKVKLDSKYISSKELYEICQKEVIIYLKRVPLCEKTQQYFVQKKTSYLSPNSKQMGGYSSHEFGTTEEEATEEGSGSIVDSNEKLDIFILKKAVICLERLPLCNEKQKSVAKEGKYYKFLVENSISYEESKYNKLNSFTNLIKGEKESILQNDSRSLKNVLIEKNCLDSSQNKPSMTINSLMQEAAAFSTSQASFSSLEWEKKISKTQKFVCFICQFKTAKLMLYAKHVKIHSDEKKNLKCCHCTYRTSTVKAFKNHLHHHTNESFFKCNQCSYQASYKQNLQIHLKIHTGERPFKCSQCSYRASYKHSLKSHLRIHTGEKPYKCSFCTYKASQHAHLKAHLRVHSGEKPYKCSHCNYSSSQSTHLKSHLRIHNHDKPFKCSYCTYRATVKSSLYTHLRTHTGEKPYKCSYCNYRATQGSALRQHLWKHAGKKPFSCYLCTYNTTVKKNLMQHLKSHENKPLNCTYCAYKTSDTDHLQNHLSKHHTEVD